MDSCHCSLWGEELGLGQLYVLVYTTPHDERSRQIDCATEVAPATDIARVGIHSMWRETSRFVGCTAIPGYTSSLHAAGVLAVSSGGGGLDVETRHERDRHSIHILAYH